MAQFSFLSNKLRVIWDWSIIAYVDGAPKLLTIRSTQLFLKELNIDTAVVGRARRLGVPVEYGPVANVAEQYIAALVKIEYPLFSESLVYDPDIRFESLFGEPEAQDMAWIAAVVVGGAVLVAILVVILSPKARAKLLPFMNRPTENPLDNTMQANLVSRTGSQNSDSWVVSSKQEFKLHNVDNECK
jgi:hypothetical protein